MSMNDHENHNSAIGEVVKASTDVESEHSRGDCRMPNLAKTLEISNEGSSRVHCTSDMAQYCPRVA
jgi:hypothetical protein